MMHIENLRPVHTTQVGLGLYESSDSNSSCTSPPAIIHPHTNRLAPALGDAVHNTLVHWSQAPATCEKSNDRSDDDEDEDDEYRPFTPPPPRERLSYTRYQLELLSGIYEKVRYPNSTQKQLIAKRVGITRDQVKIWFQNRRRKDVINNPKKAGSTSTDVSDTGNSLDSEPNTPPPSEDKKISSPSDNADGPKMVPNVVLKSVIGELERFEKTVFKAKKSKKKSRQKQQPTKQKITPAAVKSTSVSLFNAYDMISPPNKVISPSMLDTSINRFSHSKSTSAFQDPKSNVESSGIAHTTAPLMPSYHQLSNSISVVPNDYTSHHSGSGVVSASNPTPKTHSVFENIPVLADLLGYRSSDGNIHPQKSHLSPRRTYQSPNGGCTDRHVYGNIPGSVNHGSLGVNRVFPFPFIADAPVMLSSMRHPDPYRHVHYLPHQQHSEDPYQPLMISSFSNPYYSAHAPSQSWTPHPPPGALPTDNNTYTPTSDLS